ncbi:MAG: S-layer homology domain-containing protein, partial [Syntrophomonadaceae bacterium]|nr:S-layer homology domain-containing protein [Syntrophomonadaceae bacterium]
GSWGRGSGVWGLGLGHFPQSTSEAQAERGNDLHPEGAGGSASALSAFSDADDVSAWAADAMAWAVGAKLIQGDGAKLMPQDGAQRAQVAAILQRFCEKAAR